MGHKLKASQSKSSLVRAQQAQSSTDRAAPSMSSTSRTQPRVSRQLSNRIPPSSDNVSQTSNISTAQSGGSSFMRNRKDDSGRLSRAQTFHRYSTNPFQNESETEQRSASNEKRKPETSRKRHELPRTRRLKIKNLEDAYDINEQRIKQLEQMVDELTSELRRYDLRHDNSKTSGK